MTLKTKVQARKKELDGKNQRINQLETQVAKLKLQRPFTNAGRVMGTVAGAKFGFPYAGGIIGGMAGAAIGSVFGSGKYTLVGAKPRYNIFLNNQIPQFLGNGRSNIVCHREYLGDITGTTAFNNVGYPLNPGQSSTFPWLASIAQNYQEYRFHGVIFEFRSLVTDFVTGGAPGVVVMGTNYDAGAPLFTSKPIMENSEFAGSVKPTCDLIHAIECEANQTVLRQRYVRTGSVPTGQDVRVFDHGNFQFATQANPIQNLGELWVTYCVEFFKPEIPTNVPFNTPSLHISRGVALSASPTGTIPRYTLGNITITSINTTTIVLVLTPGSNYLVTMSWVGGAFLSNNPGVTVTGITGSINYFGNGGSSSVTMPSAAVATTGLGIDFVIRPSGSAVTFSIDGTGVYPSANTFDFFITGLNSLLTA